MSVKSATLIFVAKGCDNKVANMGNQLRMRFIARSVMAALVMAGLASMSPARAVDYTVTKSLGDGTTGTITLTANNPAFGAIDLVVDGLGTSAGTTRNGWEAASFFFSDPLNSCVSSTGTTISSGFCYQLTNNRAAGTPIFGPSTETFTYNSTANSGAGGTFTQNFALLFEGPNGQLQGCTGLIGSGCDHPLPEPDGRGLALVFLLTIGLAVGLRRPSLRRLALGRASALTLGILAAFGIAGAQARTTKIVIDQTKTLSIIGSNDYTLQVGRIFGELDPADAHNAVIQDISLAPLNGNNKVAYVGTISILTPISGANGVMLYQVSNRGGRSLPTASNISPGSTYVWTGWQGDRLQLPCVTAYPCFDLNTVPNGLTTSNTGPYSNAGNEVLQVPVAHNADGTSITGPAYGSILNAPTRSTTAQLVQYTTPVPYLPASLDTTKSTLYATVGQNVDGTGSVRTPVASTDWAWADCRTVPFPGTPDPTRVCLKNGYDVNKLYEMIFTAKDPLVLGIGWAATRDAVSFLRDATSGNPLSGQISHTVAMGTSQSGNYLRSFLFLWFQPERGRQEGVRDGVAAHRRTSTVYERPLRAARRDPDAVYDRR